MRVSEALGGKRKQPQSIDVFCFDANPAEGLKVVSLTDCSHNSPFDGRVADRLTGAQGVRACSNAYDKRTMQASNSIQWERMGIHWLSRKFPAALQVLAVTEVSLSPYDKYRRVALYMATDKGG
ncbi:Uncharacterized protein HZ326_23312 [Fusarium oxysporum f. sp. albedinis]|nr:Uncharacterized protein HZ326_26082 [Fusarium oxysporum f. sp. albedinis]KAJ0133619.1 Uncharacterized protein HZ326_23312 [Fusarium oxysporum f. sp. albedinis]